MPSQSERRWTTTTERADSAPSERKMRESWFALNALGFLLAFVVACINGGDGWGEGRGRIAFLICLVPIGISLAVVVLGFVSVLLYLVAAPFLPTPPTESIPRTDLRRVSR